MEGRAVRAIRYHAHGGPDVLQVSEVPTPVPQGGQVLIEVEAVGANVIDTVFRRGGGPWMRPLPGTLTGDVVGRVAALGPGVTDVAVGDRVAAVSEDAFADYAAVDAQWLARVPGDADAGEATVLPMTAPLALRLLRAGQLGPGDSVLVQAAAGGVGHLALQFAKILGAKTVIGAASSPAKLDFARACGADVAIDSSNPAWPGYWSAGHLRTAVHATFPLTGTARAHELLERRANLGRIVITA
jgi:NADPH:quinone reductase